MSSQSLHWGIYWGAMGVSDMRFLGVGCGSRDHWPETHLFGGDDGDGDDGDCGGYDTGT